MADIEHLNLIGDMRWLATRFRGHNITDKNVADAIREALEELHMNVLTAIRVRPHESGDAS